MRETFTIERFVQRTDDGDGGSVTMFLHHAVTYSWYELRSDYSRWYYLTAFRPIIEVLHLPEASWPLWRDKDGKRPPYGIALAASQKLADSFVGREQERKAQIDHCNKVSWLRQAGKS